MFKYSLEEYDRLIQFFDEGEEISLQDINNVISELQYDLQEAIEIRDRIKEG